MSRPASPPDALSRFPVGARVYALADTAVCSAHEPGVVYDAYEFGAHAGRSVIFEKGGYDGFSTDELQRFLIPEGSTDPKAASYVFQSAGRLARDHSLGVFSFIFPRSFCQVEAAEIDSAAEASGKSAPGPRV